MKKIHAIPAAAALLLAPCLRAQDTEWENPVSGDFNNAAYWTAGAPGASVNAVIRRPGDYAISLGADAEAFRLLMNPAPGAGGNVTLDFSNGGRLALKNTGNDTFQISDMRVTLLGGVLETTAGQVILLGAEGGYDGGALVVGAGGELLTRNSAQVGRFGHGNTLKVVDGGRWISDAQSAILGSHGSHDNVIEVQGADALGKRSKAVFYEFNVNENGADNAVVVGGGGEFAVARRLNIDAGVEGTTLRVSGSNAVTGVRSRVEAGSLVMGGNNTVFTIEDGAEMVVLGNDWSSTSGDWYPSRSNIISVTDAALEIRSANPDPNSDQNLFRIGRNGAGHKLLLNHSRALVTAPLCVGYENGAGADCSVIVENGGSLVCSNSMALSSNGNTLRVSGPGARAEMRTLSVQGSDNTVIVEDGAALAIRSLAHDAFGMGNDPSFTNNLVLVTNAVFDARIADGNHRFRLGNAGGGNAFKAYDSGLVIDAEIWIGVADNPVGRDNLFLLDNCALTSTADWLQIHLNSGTNNAFVARNGSVVGPVYGLQMNGGFNNSLVVSNSVFNMFSPLGINGVNNRVEVVDSVFTCAGWWRSAGANGTFSAKGPDTRVTVDQNINLGWWDNGDGTNRVEVVDGAKFECRGDVTIGDAPSGGFGVLARGEGSAFSTGHLIVGTGRDDNSGCAVEAADGASVIVRASCGVGGGGTRPDAGHAVFVDNASLAVATNLNIEAGALRVRGRSRVVAGNEFQLRYNGALACEIDAGGFTPLEFHEWARANGWEAGCALRIDGTGYQKAGFSGWVVLATNTVAYADFNTGGRRFDPANITFLHEGWKPSHYEEYEHYIRAYIPSVRRTLFMVK